MDALIRVSGGDGVTELAELYKWLSGERALAGGVRMVQRPPGEGEMGATLDAVVVLLGSGGFGIALTRSLITWLQTRRADVTIKVKSPSGEVELDVRRIKDPAVLSLLEAVLRERDER